MCVDLAKNLPIHFHSEASPVGLANLYRSASVYWHATGIDTDLAADPELAEPFDISVAEAMASGCIPVVFGSVGTAETVENGVSGLHFQDEGDLVITTLRVLAHPDEEWISAMRIAAIKRSECFAKAAFCRHWQALIDRLQLEI
jgi:glycosyltransferase involved in cell wall biosynthesis